MALVEEIDPRAPSLGVVVLALCVCVVQILCLVWLLLTTRRTLPLLELHVLVLASGLLLVIDQVARALSRVLNPVRNCHILKLTSASLRAAPHHQHLSVNRYRVRAGELHVGHVVLALER